MSLCSFGRSKASPPLFFALQRKLSCVACFKVDNENWKDEKTVGWTLEILEKQEVSKIKWEAHGCKPEIFPGKFREFFGNFSVKLSVEKDLSKISKLRIHRNS